MKYCRKCGAEMEDKCTFCPACGARQTASDDDTGSLGWTLLGCCIPIVGLVLFLVWKDSKPSNAKAAGAGALIFLGFYVIAAVLGIFSSI